MKTWKTTRVINILLVLWIIGWLYYAAFNWDVFVVGLNTNLGFAVIMCYPFITSFLAGLIALGIIKYLASFNELKRNSRIKILEKDLEIYKMKEVLFRMQTSDVSKNTETLNAVYDKLDKLSSELNKEENKPESTDE